MPTPINLAILECDTPLPTTLSEYGGYGGVFESLLHKAAVALGSDVIDVESGLVVSKWHVEGDELFSEVDGEKEGKGMGWESLYPDLEHVDGILITGSRHDSFTSPPWIQHLVQYTQLALAHPHVRVIGVCFGHQIVGRALGAEVGRNEKGWEAAVSEVVLTEKGREIFGVEEGRDMKIHQMHRDIIHSLPSPPLTLTSAPNGTTSPNATLTSLSQNLTLLGSSPTCAIQGLYTPKKLLTIQGHPEFTAPIMEEILETRHKLGVFDDEAFKRLNGKAGREHDGVRVAKGFWRFLME